MAATAITMSPVFDDDVLTFDSLRRLVYTGTGGPYNTTGGGAYDEIAYFKVVGLETVNFQLNELLGLAGTLRIYGSASSTTPDPTGSGVLTNGAWEQVGSNVAIGANAKVVTSFTNKYYWIAITFAKTGAGASTAHISAVVLSR